VKPLPTSIKEKETHWHKEPTPSPLKKEKNNYAGGRTPPASIYTFTRQKEELARIWRVTSRPLLQTKTLRAAGFFKPAAGSGGLLTEWTLKAGGHFKPDSVFLIKKGLSYRITVMNSSASQEHDMYGWLPPIHIPQAPLPLCSHPYSDPTRLVLGGEARPLAGRPAPQRSAPGSRKEGYNKFEERDPVTTTNINQPIANGR